MINLQFPLISWWVDIFLWGNIPHSGKVNCHNNYIWGTEKPQEVWWQSLIKNQSGALSGGHTSLVLSFVMKHQSMLNVPLQCCWISLHLNYDIKIFEIAPTSIQDSVPCHYAPDVRWFLNCVFPDKWISRRGPIAWPHGLLDLSPVNYILWGYF